MPETTRRIWRPDVTLQQLREHSHDTMGVRIAHHHGGDQSLVVAEFPGGNARCRFHFQFRL